MYFFSLNKISVSASLLIVLLLVCFCNTASAAAPPPVDAGSFDAASSGFKSFYTGVNSSVKKVIENSSLSNFSLTLWKFFAAVLIIWQLVQYAMKGLDFSEVFNTVLMIMITRVLMLQYDMLTTALWNWSESFATGLQVASIGVSDTFFAPRYIWNLMTSFSWPAANFLFHPQEVFAGILLGATAAALSVLGFFATVWALWGYSLAKMIGFMFIPTLLFERMSWLFDGWMRFFFGFLIYNVVSRASLMLVIIALHAYFRLPLGIIPQNGGYVFADMNSVIDALGLFVFIVLSIIGLLSTGAFVRSIASGANTGMLVGSAGVFAKSLKGLMDKLTK